MLSLALVAACAAPVERATREGVGEARSAIVGGEVSDATQDSVVLLVRYDPSLPGGAASDCSGVLLAPRLVLTARHCVSFTDASAACNEEGKSDFGGRILGDFKARQLFAFAGVARPNILDGIATAARGAELVTNGAQSICDNDIALLVLETPVAGGKIAPVRLDGPARKDESVTLVGWGVTSDGPEPKTRQQRKGVPVEEVGPAPQLGPKEFRIGEGACAGDSGGPAFSAETGAVLGVLSRGGNGTDADPSSPEGCFGGENVYTSLSGHEALLREGFETTGDEPWLEGEPDPSLPKAEPPAEEDGCAIGRRRASAGPGVEALLVAACALATLARRRSPGVERRHGDREEGEHPGEARDEQEAR